MFTQCRDCGAGLLLLHCLLCRGTFATVSRATRKLLDPASAQDRPALDLHKLAKHLHQHQQSAGGKPSTNSDVHTDGVKFVVAYCHYLLNRIYCSAAVSNRLFAQPGSSVGQSATSASDKEGGNETEIGLGESFWSQQAGEAVLSKLEALQKLQDLLLRCGQAAPPKSSGAVRGGSSHGAALAGQEGDRLSERVLELLLEDSFCVYGSINYGLIELMNRFGTMGREQVGPREQARPSCARGVCC